MFFRCLKYYNNNSKKVKKYFCERLYKNILNIKSHVALEGVKLSDIEHPEKCFSKIFLGYSLFSNGTVKLVYNSLTSFTEKIYLGLYENHLSHITNFKKIANKFQCEKCKKLFKREWALKVHFNSCNDRTTHIFPGGFHKESPTIFKKKKNL